MSLSLYINDINNNISATVRLFADDTILYSSIKDSDDAAKLQTDLEQLEKWEERWQMGFNVSKCHVLTVSRKQNLVNASYTLHQQPLERVKKAKYLGVELSNDLSWGPHIQAVSAKGHRTSAFLARNLKGCPQQTQSQCFKAIVRPVLEYASPIWDPHQKTHVDSLEAVQRRAARRITKNFSREASASALVSELNLQPLQQRRQTSKAVLMYKVMNGLLDITPSQGVIQPTTRTTR